MSSGQTEFDFQKPPVPENAGSRGQEMLPGTVLLRKSRFLSQLLLLYFHALFDCSPEVLYLCQAFSSLVTQGWLGSAPLSDSLPNACRLVPLEQKAGVTFLQMWLEDGQDCL